MCRASGFYIDAGPEGEEDLCRVRDPGRLVEAIALEDGLRLKGEAVRLLRWDVARVFAPPWLAIPHERCTPVSRSADPDNIYI